MAVNQENIVLDEEPAAQEASVAAATAAAAAYQEAAQAADNPPDAGEAASENGDAASEIDPQAAEIEKLKAEIAEKSDQLLRKQAEFQNFRRRTLKEKEELSQLVTQNILKSLLPTIDNFERALSAEATDAASLKKGVEMIYANFAETLKSHGLKAIETAGQQFDPNFHQAVMRVENAELPDNAIAAELQRGYMVGEAVIRPSMVQVVTNN